MLGLGARLSEQGYSADDRALLGNLASQAAPAVRVAQLVRQHQSEALARELREYVKTRLSAHEYPRVVEFVEMLPRTPSGKIQRSRLAQMIHAGELTDRVVHT